MPKITDTYERAYAACATLAARGINPTVKTVAEFIGTNSPAIISPAIKDWRQSVAVESLRRLEIPEVPERLVEATIALWRLAVEEAQLSLAKEREAMAEEKAALTAQLAQAEAARLAAQQDHVAHQERAVQQIQTLQTALAQHEAELKQLRSEQAQAAQDLALAREANAGLSGSLAEAQRNLSRQQAEWEEKFDRDHAWHLGRIAEERERAQREAAEKRTHLEESLTHSRLHAVSLKEALDQSAATALELRAELKVAREERTRLSGELETARNAQAEALRQGFEAEKRLAEADKQRDRLQTALSALQREHETLLGKSRPAKKSKE